MFQQLINLPSSITQLSQFIIIYHCMTIYIMISYHLLLFIHSPIQKKVTPVTLVNQTPNYYHWY
jgi:hypothetical protein